MRIGVGSLLHLLADLFNSQFRKFVAEVPPELRTKCCRRNVNILRQANVGGDFVASMSKDIELKNHMPSMVQGVYLFTTFVKV